MTKNKLENLLLSYNLYRTLNLPNRIHNNSIRIIDIILIDKVKYENYSICLWLRDYLFTMPKL